MLKTTKDKKIDRLVHRHIIAELREIFSDPDVGLALRSDTIRRLQKSVRSKKSGQTKDLKVVLARHHV